MVVDKKQIEQAVQVRLTDVPNHNAPAIKGLLERGSNPSRPSSSTWAGLLLAKHGSEYTRRKLS